MTEDTPDHLVALATLLYVSALVLLAVAAPVIVMAWRWAF